jgi:hypothetical protein
MIGLQACQKGGSMRSKPVIATACGAEKPAGVAPAPRPLHPAGPLTLVTSGETRPAGATKPGLY